MRDTIVSAVREAGILCRTANQMRRASKFIAQAFATAAHVHCERPVSAQTLSAGRFFFIRIILRYCGLGVGILLGPSVNESAMPPIAHVSRAFTEKRKLGMGWPGRTARYQAYLTAAAVNLKRLAAAIAFLLMLLLIQISQSPSCTATGWDRLLQRPRLYASHLLSGRPCRVNSGAISHAHPPHFRRGGFLEGGPAPAGRAGR